MQNIKINSSHCTPPTKRKKNPYRTQSKNKILEAIEAKAAKK